MMLYFCKDLYDNGIIPYGEPKGQIWKQLMTDHKSPVYAELGRRMILPPTWDEFWYTSEVLVTQKVE